MISFLNLHIRRSWRPLCWEALALFLIAAFIPHASFSQTALKPSEFTVGNRLLSRVFKVEDDQASTEAFKALTETKVRSLEFEILLKADGHTILLNRHNCSPRDWSVAPSGLQADLSWVSAEPSLEIHVKHQADQNHPYIFKWIEVSNRGGHSVLIERVVVDSLEVLGYGGPMRGGVGQPVFIKNEFFLGIEHPAADNRIEDKGIILAHHPDAELAPGARWKSKRAVIGAAVAPGESVEDAFRTYLEVTTDRGPVYRPIFCDWAAHDELGTLVKPQLTEQLTNSLLDQLDSLKSKFGIEFNYYLMDAFWYDPKGAYLTFKKPNWPNGYEPALRRMLNLGMKPGLWFDLGGSTLDLKDTPNWQGPEKPCLSDLAFTRLFENALAFHIRDHSLSMLKFDFSNLLCSHESAPTPSLAALEKNADALREITEKARELNPALVIRAYNGFSLSEAMMDGTTYYDQAYPISPWWVRWFDSVYCGDPRPSELPSVTSLRDSVNWYQDHVFRGYARSLMPLFTIDDSGTLVGNTSTILYLGAEGFTDSWILNVMRGGLAPIFYGDLTLLTENDRKFMAGTLRFLREHLDVLAKTRLILGIPGRGEVYGYLSNNEGTGFATIVNPGLFPQSFSFVAPNEQLSQGFERLIFSNDGQAQEPTRRLEGVLQGKVIPGEIRVYALGPRERVERVWLPSAPSREYHEVTPIGDPFGSSSEADIQIGSGRAGMTLAVIIRYRKAGEPDRSYERPQEVLRVTEKIGSNPVNFVSIPREDTDIWSHCSWAVFKHRMAASETNQRLTVKLEGQTPAGTTRLITAQWLK